MARRGPQFRFFYHYYEKPVEKSQDPIEGNEEDDYDEQGSDNEDDEVREARKKIKVEKKLEFDLLTEIQSIERLSQRSHQHDFEEECSDYDSDNHLDSPEISDAEDYGHLIAEQPKPKKKKILTHSSHMLTLRHDDEKHFFLGQQFEDANEFRKAITNYCVSQGRDVDFTRNDQTRLGAKCKAKDKGCPWYIWASLEKEKGTLVVKTLIPKHNCGRLPTIKKLKASWVAENYHSKFKVNPYLKCQEIVDTIWSEYGIKVSLWLALKARRKAQQLILGEYTEQYSLLYRYASEIKKIKSFKYHKI